ncbi:MAG TPA: sulfotransferase domain-containing protein [Rubrobacteraceae bacterium]|nr:sulfotransferase domain-containing protein [Rubrobacteraceae bacterium]
MSAYFRLVSLYHGARLKGAGLRGGFAKSVRTDSVNPENVVWIFCTGRSGSTWLRSMMEELAACKVWEEPKVGQLFGEFYYKARERRLVSTNFVMGDPTRKAWMRALRNFVLETAWAAHPDITPQHYLIVKEPDGAIGAPLLMEALPESRMVLLVRDPRDVAASALDGMSKGSWRYKWHSWGAAGGAEPADERPDAFVKNHAKKYVRHIGNAKKAYDAYEGRKALIRYEDLKADTLGTMRYLCSVLEVPVGQERLARIVEKHSWENVPKEEKGQGKFYRKATPGGWREDLTPKQISQVERITASLLEEFYSDNTP